MLERGRAMTGRLFKNNYPEGLLLDPEDEEYFRQFHIWISNGYAVCKLGLLHRLIAKPKNGLIVDHINRNRLDDRRENLRCIPKSSNGYNRNRPSNNTSGVVGVRWVIAESLWQATISLPNGKRKHLGTRKDFFEAVCLRKSAELTHYAAYINGL
jgi:hypothetical protein